MSGTPANRRERERTEMRELVVAAARKLFVAEGFERTTIRRIAEEIEYTPGAIYSYFADKDAILHALHVQGFEELGRAMQAAVAKATDPLAALKALGRAYIKYAREQPDLYELMFVAHGPLKEHEEWPEGTKTYDGLVDVVTLALQTGHLRGSDPETIAFSLWSFCHGMVMLESRERCKMFDDRDISGMIEKAFEHTLSVFAKDEDDEYNASGSFAKGTKCAPSKAPVRGGKKRANKDI